MKTFIYICLLVIGLVLPAGAQVPIQSYRGQVSVKQNRIEREGNSLRLDLTINRRHKRYRYNYSFSPSHTGASNRRNRNPYTGHEPRRNVR